MIIKCKSLFNGNASIGSQFLDIARKSQEDIVIKHKGLRMTVRPFMFSKFFEMGKKRYRDKKDPTKFYTLKYISFIPDEKSPPKENMEEFRSSI